MAFSLRPLWLRLSAWTPILLLAVAAAFSWWVAQVVMQAEHGPNTSAAAPQLPDYVLRNFSAASYSPQGQLRAVLHGTQMVHNPGSSTFDITAPRLRAVNPLGIVTTATAQRGLSNRDASNVQLLGDAVVERSAAAGQPPVVVRSDFLNVFPNRQVVQSDQPTVVQRGDTIFSGNSLDFNGIDGTVGMQGRVNGVIPPSPAAAGKP